MSRYDRVVRLARRSLVAWPGSRDDPPTEGLIALAVDRVADVAVVLLVSLPHERRKARSWFFAFERRAGDWHVVFDHNEFWLDEPLRRPDGDPPLYLNTGVRGDATSDGRPILCFAGVVTSAAHRVALQTATGQREIAIDADTGAFVVIDLAETYDLVVEGKAGEIVDRSTFSAPPRE